MSIPSIGPSPPDSPTTADVGSSFNSKAIASWQWLTLQFFPALEDVNPWIVTGKLIVRIL